MYVQTNVKALMAIREHHQRERAMNEAAAAFRGITINQFYEERDRYYERVQILKRLWIRSWRDRPELSDAILNRCKSTKQYYVNKLRGI